MSMNIAVYTPEHYALAVLRAEEALEEANTLSEVVTFRDQAEAIRQFADTARYGLKFQNLAAALKLKAERKAGEILGDLERQPGGTTRFGAAAPDSVSGADVSEYRRTIEDLRINERSARRWQEVARVPESAFRRFIEEADSAGDPVEITTQALLRMGKAIEADSRRAQRRTVPEEVTPPVGVSKTRAAVAERAAEVQRLTEAGHKRNDIGERLGLSDEVVAKIQQRIGITSVEARFGRSKRIDVNRVMDGIVSGAGVPQTSIDLLDGQWGQLDGELLAGWIDSLNDSIAALSKVRGNLRKELDERAQ